MISIKNIRKIFDKNTVNEKVALDNLSLQIEKGEFITVIGSNGAGKTTLLNLIAGTHLPDEGEIFIDDVNVTKMPEHKRAIFMSRIFQNPLMGTASSMTIAENLAIANFRGKRRGFRWAVSKNLKREYAEVLAGLGLGLEDRLTQPVNLLSGGQRQSLTLLMATLALPRLLLLDEHTGSLDPKTAAKVIELTDRIVKENALSTLMITHNMKIAIDYGTRMIMLHEGKILFDIREEQKKNLTVDEVVRQFGKDLKDETLLVASNS